MSDSELDDFAWRVLLALKAQGFTVTRSRRGHYVVSNGGGLVTILFGTSYRGWRGSIEILRGAGFIWPLPRRRWMHHDE